MTEWNSALAGKTIKRVEIRELDKLGDKECVRQIIAFVLSDGSTVIGQTDGGDLEAQYATLELLTASSFDQVLAEAGEVAEWYDEDYQGN